MKFWKYLICGVLVVLAVLATVDMVQTFNVQGGEYGSIVVWETPQNALEFAKYDCGYINFEEDNGLYSYTWQGAPENFNGRRHTYAMQFDQRPLTNLSQNAGRLAGDLVLYFQLPNGDEDSVATVHFELSYLASGTRLTVTMRDADAVSYFNTFMNLNGAVLTVNEIFGGAL